MKCRIGDVTVNYAEHGSGTPVLALHGVGVDHREIEAAVEALVPRDGYRRIYPDLPAMGRSTADGLTSNDDVVELLGHFLKHIGAESAFLLGHSYGAYLARGLASHQPESTLGLALICPIGASTGDVPDHQVVREDDDAHDELDADQRQKFDDYFVIRTARTARRYRDTVAPGTLVDENALGRIFAGWPVDVSGAYSGPTLIVAGRRDSTAGYADAVRLLPHYPRASLAVLDDAGHALLHEQPDLLRALLEAWLRRMS